MNNLFKFGDCEWTFKTPESKSPYSYRCGLHVRYGKSFCTSHNIRGTILEQLILEDIRRQIDFVTNDDKARAKYLARKQGNIALVMAEDNKRKREIEKRLDDLGKLMQKIYEDRVLEKITEERYLDMNGKYENEYAGLKTEKEELLAAKLADRS